MHTGAEAPGPTPGASEVAFAPHPAPPGLAVPIPPGDDQATPRAGPVRVPLVCLRATAMAHRRRKGRWGGRCRCEEPLSYGRAGAATARAERFARDRAVLRRRSAPPRRLRPVQARQDGSSPSRHRQDHPAGQQADAAPHRDHRLRRPAGARHQLRAVRGGDRARPGGRLAAADRAHGNGGPPVGGTRTAPRRERAERGQVGGRLRAGASDHQHPHVERHQTGAHHQDGQRQGDQRHRAGLPPARPADARAFTVPRSYLPPARPADARTLEVPRSHLPPARPADARAFTVPRSYLPPARPAADRTFTVPRSQR
jgi:hypothetical protein